MAKDKKSVLIYVDWISIFEELSDEEAGKLVKHLFRYVNDKNPEAPDRLTKLLFEPIKQALKRDLVKYEKIREKNRDNVNVRWNKKDTTVYDRIPNDTKHTDNDIDNDNVIDIVKDKKKRKKPFVPPLLEEVKLYFKENGYNEETAIKMFNSYSVADWHDSKGNKISNWKQKAINVWFRDENKIKIRMLA